MRIKLNLFISSLIAPFLLTGCFGSSSFDSAEGNQAQTLTGSRSLQSISYFKGGYYPPPDTPNWSSDLIIRINSEGVGQLEAKTYDESCIRSGNLSGAELDSLLSYIENLDTELGSNMGMIDAGVEYIELTFSNGTQEKIHLAQLDVTPGEYVATNGATLSEYLQDLQESTPQLCQSL